MPFQNRGLSPTRLQAAQSRFHALLGALNQTAVFPPGSVRSEEEVLLVVSDRLGQLGLSGAIGRLDESNGRVTVHAFSQVGTDLGTKVEKALAKKGVSHSFALAAVDVYREVHDSGRSVFVADTTVTLTQMVPDASRRSDSALGKLYGQGAGIFSPLKTGKRVWGFLSVTDPGLAPTDVPAIEALANHLAMVIENARLVVELQETNARLTADIGERQRVEQALREKEASLLSLTESAPDAIIGLDTAGRITAWNASATRIFGYDAASAIGGNLAELILPAAARADFVNQLAAFIRTGKGSLAGDHSELAAHGRDGQGVVVEATFARVKRSGAWSATSIMRDVTGRRRLDNELGRLEKLESVGFLAGGLAHDFNNLLTAVLGSITLARDQDASPQMVAQSLGAAETAVVRASTLTQQLLTFSRGGKPQKQSAGLAELVRRSAEFVASGSQARCQFEFSEDLWPVHIDVGQIGQVIDNLVINATQAMPEGGTITIAAENKTIAAGEIADLSAGRYVVISISDQGPGIPAHLATQVFDPFFTTKTGGTGLGLAVTHSIIRSHGGHIRIEVPETGGTRITFTLHAAEEPAAKARPVDKIKGGDERILLMDDEEIVRSVTTRMLKKLGYQVTTATTGEEAIARFDQAKSDGQPFSLVILDLTVPAGMGGKRTAHVLRTREPNIKVIVSSGYSTDPVMASHRAHGFDSALLKPYKITELATILRAVLDTDQNAPT